jgi:hypothetical protein
MWGIAYDFTAPPLSQAGCAEEATSQRIQKFYKKFRDIWYMGVEYMK